MDGDRHLLQTIGPKKIRNGWSCDHCGSNSRIVYPNRRILDLSQQVSPALLDEATLGRRRTLVAKLLHSSEIWNPSGLNQSCRLTACPADPGHQFGEIPRQLHKSGQKPEGQQLASPQTSCSFSSGVRTGSRRYRRDTPQAQIETFSWSLLALDYSRSG